MAQNYLDNSEGKESKKEKNVLPLQNIINERGEVNYDEVKRTADAIEEGTAHIDRLSLAEEQGRTRGGRRNVEASILLGGTERGIVKNTQERSGSQSEKTENDVRKEQEQRLIDWAKKVGIFEEYEKATTKRKLYDSVGTEAKVYEGETENTVIKITYPYQFSNTPLEFLDNRISLHNYLFPETAYILIGITQKGKAIAFILEQPFIDTTKEGTINMDFSDPELLEKYRNELDKRGLKMSDKDRTTIYNDDYIIDDLHEDNIFMDKDGNFFFIDTVPSLNTAEDYFGGEREYSNGEVVSGVENKRSEKPVYKGGNVIEYARQLNEWNNLQELESGDRKLYIKKI